MIRTLRTAGVLMMIAFATSGLKPNRLQKYSTIVSFSPSRAPLSLVSCSDFSSTTSGQRTIQGISFLPRTCLARSIRSATIAGEYLNAHRSARMSSRFMYCRKSFKFSRKFSLGTRNMKVRRANCAATSPGARPVLSAKK
uniref:Putative secreted protein n=1 Tax=Anopheles marajoara TaxID=58244 RepID=A0A2M4C6J9_9DIPT